MRKIITIIALLLLSLSSVLANNPLEGSWRNGNVQYTFRGDTLFIDDLGIEGDIYLYKLKSDGTLVMRDALGNITSNVKIESITLASKYCKGHRSKIVIRIDNKRFTFYKVNQKKE